MKKRSYIAIAAVIAAITLGLGLATVPAHAQAATYELTDDNGGSSLCMNRDGGGTANNTPVIAYNCGNVNNDFYWGYLTTMCGSGTVTDTCPFTDGSGLNLACRWVSARSRSMSLVSSSGGPASCQAGRPMRAAAPSCRRAFPDASQEPAGMYPVAHPVRGAWLVPVRVDAAGLPVAGSCTRQRQESERLAVPGCGARCSCTRSPHEHPGKRAPLRS
jgi:hypothetical protein